MSFGSDEPPNTAVDRRDFIKLTGFAAAVTAVGQSAGRASAEAEKDAPTVPEPITPVTPDENTSDIIVETLIAWGATHVFGIVGEGINPIVEALRKRRDRIAFIGVRHEEAAAFMAGGMAKHGGRLGVCLADTGPGAVHSLNGLYDSARDNAPVIVLTGATYHDLEGMRFSQNVDTVKLMEDVALFNERVTGPANALLVTNRACRAALAGRGVAHLTVGIDVQQQRLSADPRSPENHGGRSSSSWSPPMGAPPAEQLRQAAEVLNAGKRVAIVAGQGCVGAVPQLRHLATLLGAPIAKAYLAKALLPDGDPLTTGGIGHLGTAPSQWAMRACDTVVILGTMMPWINYYPQPGQARGVQIDIKPEHIGVKYPVEVGLTGEMGATLDALIPLVTAKTDQSFIGEARTRMRDWRALLDRVEQTQKGTRLQPQAVMRALSRLAPANAVFSMDCGANTHFAARHVQLREGQRWTGSGTHVSMASALPLAIAGAFSHPDRPSIAVAGDGGFSMLMAELSTAVFHHLNVKVMVLNNDALAQVINEQREIGAEEYGCRLGHIDFAAYARAAGAHGFSAASLPELDSSIRSWLSASGPAVLDVQVDPAAQSPEPDKLTA